MRDTRPSLKVVSSNDMPQKPLSDGPMVYAKVAEQIQLGVMGNEFVTVQIDGGVIHAINPVAAFAMANGILQTLRTMMEAATNGR